MLQYLCVLDGIKNVYESPVKLCLSFLQKVEDFFYKPAVLFIEPNTYTNKEVAIATRNDETVIRHRISWEALTLLCVYTVGC